jgi:Phosphate-selective porin O and P.
LFNADWLLYWTINPFRTSDSRADSRFDIRRARIHLKGNISTQLAYLMAFEFQGNETQHLVDAFADYHFNTFLQFVWVSSKYLSVMNGKSINNVNTGLNMA